MATYSDADAFWRFADEIGSRARYVRSPESQEFLRCLAATSRRRLRAVKAGATLWRAQVGHAWVRDRRTGARIREPHDRSRMKPLHDRAYEGRVNPKGIPCLYFATTRQVAMCEVRPWIGSVLSVARFRTLRDLRLADCSWRDGGRGDGGTADGTGDPWPPEIERAIWQSVDEAYSRPVTETDNKAEYAATQAFAEALRSEGLDGLVYRSAFAAEGANVAIFDLEAAEVAGEALYEASGLNIEFREIAG